MRIFENLNIDFLGKRKIFYVISAILLVLGLGSLIFRGLELGIDFKGGSEIVLQFDNPIEIADIRNNVSDLGLGDVEVKTFGTETGVLIRTELQLLPDDIFPKVVAAIDSVINLRYAGIPISIVDSTDNSLTYQFDYPDTVNTLITDLRNAGFQAGKVSQEPDNVEMIVRIGIADWIKENLREKMPDNDFLVLREDRVGPKVGDELKMNAIVAIILSLVVILIYLGFRFKFIFAAGAVAALFHDVLITVGLFSLMYGVFSFLNLTVDLTVVAGFLTLVGYSINDTVIVFDRVRENLKLHKSEDLEKLINRSINKTMSRTILTGGTTLITVLVLLLLGGEVLRAFSFTLFFGIIIGTYSSIFVASALVLEYAKKAKAKVEF
jgi:preprotein translocase SecF subunit